MFSAKSIMVTAALLATSAIAIPASAQETRDLALEEANRKRVPEFFDRVFNRHDVAGAAEVMADDYIQHSPHSPNGKSAFVSRFTEVLKATPESKVRIVRSASEGDLVWLHAHGLPKPDDRGVALIEIFRVKDRVIVEHWNVGQPVPEKAANDNTMF